LVIKALRLDFVQKRVKSSLRELMDGEYLKLTVKQPLGKHIHPCNVKCIYIMKKICILVILSALLVNCSKDEKVTSNACNTDNPMENIDWLKAMKDSLTNCSCQISIVQGTYRNHPVFYLALTDPLCDGVLIPTLVDCNGKVVKKYNETDIEDFYHQVSIDTVLYSCKNK
jgi:hypothetical protein